MIKFQGALVIGKAICFCFLPGLSRGIVGSRFGEPSHGVPLGVVGCYDSPVVGHVWVKTQNWGAKTDFVQSTGAVCILGLQGVTGVTLWLFNIAMENGPFIDDFPIKTSVYKGVSMAIYVK